MLSCLACWKSKVSPAFQQFVVINYPPSIGPLLFHWPTTTCCLRIVQIQTKHYNMAESTEERRKRLTHSPALPRDWIELFAWEHCPFPPSSRPSRASRETLFAPSAEPI